jgi:hypothetical protein
LQERLPFLRRRIIESRKDEITDARNLRALGRAGYSYAPTQQHNDEKQPKSASIFKSRLPAEALQRIAQ